MNKPHPHDIEALLRRDAARVREPTFDPALHHATLRKIRALSERSRPLAHRPWVLTFAATAVLLALGFAAAFWHPRQPIAQFSPSPTVSAPSTVVHSCPASAWAYRVAALQGDEALLARLDLDSRQLLTPTSPVFSNPQP